MENAGELGLARGLAVIVPLGAANVGMAGNARQLLRDLSRRQHKIRRAKLSTGAAWHVRVLRGVLILCERDTALGFDGCQQ